MATAVKQRRLKANSSLQDWVVSKEHGVTVRTLPALGLKLYSRPLQKGLSAKEAAQIIHEYASKHENGNS